MLIGDPEPDPDQLSFNFGLDGEEEADAPESGLSAWREDREKDVRKLATVAGLPVEHLVEVTLLSGPVLRGRLKLAVNSLWIEVDHVEKIVFEVDGTPFRKSEIEACVRTD